MDANQLYIFTAAILFFTFCLGWLACWGFIRMRAGEEMASADALEEIRELKDRLQTKEKEFSATEAQYANAYSQLEAELDATMSGLKIARQEVKELRDQQNL